MTRKNSERYSAIGREEEEEEKMKRGRIDCDAAPREAMKRRRAVASSLWAGRPANREWRTWTRGRIRCEMVMARSEKNGWKWRGNVLRLSFYSSSSFRFTDFKSIIRGRTVEEEEPGLNRTYILLLLHCEKC